MATTQQVREWWAANECKRAKLVTVSFFGRSPVYIAPELVAATLALEDALLDSGYQPTGGPIGSYVCRNIAGRDTRSLHAFGVALDVEYNVNPRLSGPAFQRGWGSDPRCRLTEANIDAAESVVNVYGEPIWRWLGYITNPDTMHFQVNVPPDRTSIEEETVFYLKTDPATPAKGQKVEYWKRLVKAAGGPGSADLVIDQTHDAAFDEALRPYVSGHGIAGGVGPGEGARVQIALAGLHRGDMVQLV